MGECVVPITLSDEQVLFYKEHGYLVVENVLSSQKLAQLRSETDAIIAGAGRVSESNDIYDLEESHTPANPRVRRIKNPYEHSDYFNRLARDPDILHPLVRLLGPDIRLYGGKMNMKSAGYGAPVEWHQDWAFYPHTNDDVLATGILLDDCDESNGPLMVIPGTHKGPTYSHHQGGHFCGAMEPGADGLDYSRAVPLTGKAGSMTIHHVRLVHGSAMNTSNRPRRLLLWEYAAADAWPLVGTKTAPADYDSRIVLGNPPAEIRVREAPVRMPYPPAPHQGSIYENQKDSGRRFFETFEERLRATA
jgi:phytanoyl-CoA hydroxylase